METPVKNRTRTILIVVIVLLGLILACLLAAAVLIPPPDGRTAEEPTEAATLPPETEPETEPTETEPVLLDLPLNPYGEGDFQYEGRYLTCTAGESVLGIDVSEHQEITDWNLVKQSGVEFVFIRVAYRGYGTGALALDEYAQDFYQGAKDAGLKVGAYIFSQAVNPREAREEANLILQQTADWELDLPIVFDWEYINDTARTANISSALLTLVTKTFCRTIEEAGQKPMVYFNLWQRMGWDLEELKDYDLWLAMYSSRMDYPYAVDYWQYTSGGFVPGIKNLVDMNLYFPGIKE